jgi:hypothetical protein
MSQKQALFKRSDIFKGGDKIGTILTSKATDAKDDYSSLSTSTFTTLSVSSVRHHLLLFVEVSLKDWKS